MVATINQQPLAVNTPFIPRIGPKSVPLSFDFSVAGNYSVDLSLQIASGAFDKAQSLFVDNSGNTAAVTLSFSGMSQNIIIPPSSQGYVPVLAGQTAQGAVSSTGNGKTIVHILNFPVGPGIWSATNGAFLFTAGGLLEVSDVALDAIISGGALTVNPKYTGSGDVLYPMFKSQNAMSGNTTGSVANLLVGGNGFFVNFVDIYITGDASMGPAVISGTAWDPAHQFGLVFSGGNLVIHTDGSTNASTRSVLGGFTTGKYYYEQTLSVAGANITQCGAGLINSTGSLSVGFAAANAGVRMSDGAIMIANTSQGTTGGAFVAGNVLGVAIDWGNKLLWARNNAGNWNNNASANPATGTLGISFSVVPVSGGYYFWGYAGTSTGDTMTANFGSSAFANAAPSGFIAPGTTLGGTMDLTVSLLDGTATICQGVASVGATQATTSTGVLQNVKLIDNLQMNYDSKVNGQTLSLTAVGGGGVAQSLSTGLIVYNIGAGLTNTVN